MPTSPQRVTIRPGSLVLAAAGDVFDPGLARRPADRRELRRAAGADGDGGTQPGSRIGLLWPQLDTAPFPNYFLVEPPIYESGVVVLKRATGLSLEEAGRILSALATALAALGLFVLARRREGALVAFLAVAAFAVFPLTIRYGRAFQPDAAMLGAVVLGLACWDRHRSQSALVLARGRPGSWSRSVSRSRSPPRFCSCRCCW